MNTEQKYFNEICDCNEERDCSPCRNGYLAKYQAQEVLKEIKKYIVIQASEYNLDDNLFPTLAKINVILADKIEDLEL